MTQLRIRGNTQIMSDTITDTQINSAAAIATTKLADGANFLKKDGSVTWTGDHNAGGFKLTNLAQGVNPNDAVTYSQLQDVAAGVSVKDAVRVASTGSDIDVATGGLLTVDGVTLVAGNRVLVKDQTDPIENGVYVAAAGAWSRASDFDDVPSTEVRGGNLVFVQQGTVNANTSWILTGTGDLVVNTDPLNFTQFSGAGTQTASNVGTGEGVFKQLSGNNFEFKSLADTAEINVTAAANELSFSIVAGSIVGSKIASATITGANLVADTITGAHIASSAISSSELANDAVITSKILDGNVTLAKLAADSVDASKIVDGSVGNAELATDAVTTVKIADNAITQAKMADNAVGTDELVALSVTSAKLADDSVITSKILNGNVTLAKLAADSVDASKIVDGSVGNAELATDAVTDVKVAAAAAIARSKLASGSADHVVINNGSGVMSSEAQLALVRGGTNADLSAASSHAFLHMNAAGTAVAATLLTSSRALVSDGNGLPSASSVTATELGYLSGVTSSIQTQLDARISENNFVFNETPSGAIDGVNTSFALATAPIAGKLQVMLNGLVLRPGAGNDYTLSGSTITMLYAPASGDYLAATYVHE